VTFPLDVPAHHDERGFATVQYVATVGLSLLLLVLFANLLVDLYARGAIRDALDEGVRAAAARGATIDECEARAAEVLTGLLHGPIGDDVRVRCETEGASVVARAEGSLPSWLPFAVPPWRVSYEARMRTET
jgi:hypothetical protein